MSAAVRLGSQESTGLAVSDLLGLTGLVRGLALVETSPATSDTTVKLCILGSTSPSVGETPAQPLFGPIGWLARKIARVGFQIWGKRSIT